MTDERSSDPELVLRAESLAAKLSMQEPDWEGLATRVSARIAEKPALDETLLAAPLPEEEGESELDRLVRPKRAPQIAEAASAGAGVSLADLARASVARRGGREAASIAKESLAVATQAREKADRISPVQATAPAAVSSSRRPGAALADSRGPWIGVAIAAVGLAAGFGLYIAGQRQAPELVSLPAPVAPVVRGPDLPKGEPLRAPVSEPKALDDGPAPVAQAFDELPAAADEAGVRPPSGPSPERTAAPTSKAAPAGRPFGTPVAPERVVLEEDRAPARPPGASATARAPQPAESTALRPAELTQQGGAADRPSAGAAQAAVGAVLGAARACIAGHATPSGATLVFDSSGQVERVTVSGPAAGTAAAGCVESALKKARVQPFAAESFSLGVTIRPP